MKMMHLDVSGVAGLQFDMGEPTPDNIVLCCHRQDYYACQLCRNIDIEERLSAIKQTFQQYVTSFLLNLDIIYSIKEKKLFLSEGRNFMTKFLQLKLFIKIRLSLIIIIQLKNVDVYCDDLIYETAIITNDNLVSDDLTYRINRFMTKWLR